MQRADRSSDVLKPALTAHESQPSSFEEFFELVVKLLIA